MNPNLNVKGNINWIIQSGTILTFYLGGEGGRRKRVKRRKRRIRRKGRSRKRLRRRRSMRRRRKSVTVLIFYLSEE